MTVPVSSTLADGIAVNRPGDLTFPIIQKYVDEMVLVEEEGIAGATATHDRWWTSSELPAIL